MATITLESVSKLYDTGPPAISGLDLAIGDGEFLVLVGPSGCGKSTALRMIAGLETISSGRLSIDGKVVNETSPRERNIAMVFQSYALYPHLTVAGNIGFGLAVRDVPRTAIAAKVRDVAERLELTDLLNRKPGQLSGGQRQRVAMGRALVRAPRAFLMDEPLSNLDARLRGQMRAEIAALQAKTGVTTVYVTHDQVEAMTMGHRVAVLRRGVLQQLDRPRRLYDAPANLCVAGFIGAPAMNLLAGLLVRDHDGIALRLGAHRVDWNASKQFVLGPGEQLKIVAGIRPEALSIDGTDETKSGSMTKSSAPSPSLPGRIAFVEDLGATLLAHVDVEGAHLVAGPDEDEDDFTRRHVRLRIVLDGRLAIRSGDAIRLRVDPDRLHLFDAVTGLALMPAGVLRTEPA